MNALARWMKQASPVARERLAKSAKTTIGTLRQIAGSYRKTSVTADLAARIDRAVVRVNRTSGVGKLPTVPRESLCPTCARCEFARRCRS